MSMLHFTFLYTTRGHDDSNINHSSCKLSRYSTPVTFYIPIWGMYLQVILRHDFRHWKFCPAIIDCSVSHSFHSHHPPTISLPFKLPRALFTSPVISDRQFSHKPPLPFHFNPSLRPPCRTSPCPYVHISNSYISTPPQNNPKYRTNKKHIFFYHHMAS